MTLRMTQIQIKHQEPVVAKVEFDSRKNINWLHFRYKFAEQLIVIFQGHFFVLQQVIFEVDASSRHTI